MFVPVTVRGVAARAHAAAFIWGGSLSRGRGRGLIRVTDACAVVAGRYRLAYRIAAGGAGEVWRALDTALDRPVAIKLLRPEYAGHAEALARFRAEARHAGALSHPGITQIYDYGDADPPHRPYLVMEVVDGPSLAGVLAAGPLEAGRVMDVVAQVAAGLAAAHAAGLVHRDIKPANLLLDPGGQVKITDFGIAHAAGSAPLTRTGTVVGSPAYLAPERAAGGSAVPASDLYSLGIVAFECLTGVVPFTGSPLEVVSAHLHSPLPPLPPGVPDAVGALVAELTAKDPAARPASAGVVAERAGRLREAMTAPGTAALSTRADPPVPAQTVALAEQPVRGRGWPWQRAVLALAAAVMAAGLVVALAGSLAQEPQRRPHPAATAGAAAPPSGRAQRHIDGNQQGNANSGG